MFLRTCKMFSRFCTNNNSLSRLKYFTETETRQLISKPNQLRQYLLHQMESTGGEMKIQRYWKAALTDPQLGYYSNKNVFSKEGDFTTSPEISPLFGEMVGTWISYFLRKTKIFNEQTNSVDKKFRIVQLGGGRGLLMSDIIKVLSNHSTNNNFQICMIQMSDFNRKAQQDAVMQRFKQNNHFFKFMHEEANQKHERFVSENEDKNIELSWYENIESLYQKDIEMQKKGQITPFTIFVMNQFFDALPSTILQYTQNGWKQKVLKKAQTQNIAFELKTSSSNIPEKMIPHSENPQIGTQIQISYQSLMTMDLLAKIVNINGGAILNIDYGDEGFFSDSIRAIKDHRFIPSPQFWSVPGECDLSAYVNFKSLADFAERNQGIVAYEAIPQGYFLESMGIVPRIDTLKKSMKQQKQKRLDSQYNRLVLPEEMGQIYKVQIITKKEYGQVYPHVEGDENSF